jgi:tRNA (adenine22-N1)-methyltransferase
MKLPLSKRLHACADFIKNSDRVADVGCDHGYLGIHLLQNGIAASVIASDVRPMPLKTAMANAEKYGTADRMEFHLSDGVTKIPRDFDVLVCAGMGADTIISILEAAPWLKHSNYRLILQCQTRTPLLRHYLSESGWFISDEKVLRDGHFLYTVMEVMWQPDRPRLSPGQWFFSPALLQSADKELPEFYQYQCFRLRRIIEGRKNQTEPLILAALTELESIAVQPHNKWLTEVKYDFS